MNLPSGNHESPRILTFQPSPIPQVEPRPTTFLAFKMLCQAYEYPVSTSLSMIEQLEKYLALNNKKLNISILYYTNR